MPTPDSPGNLHPGELNFAQNLKALRAELGESQETLAKKMRDQGFENFNQMTVSRIEKGTRPVRFSEARALAYLVGSSTEQMASPAEASRTLNSLFEAVNKIDSYASRIAEVQADGILLSMSQIPYILDDLDRIDLDDLQLPPQVRYQVTRAREKLEKFRDGGQAWLRKEVDRKVDFYVTGDEPSDDGEH